MLSEVKAGDVYRLVVTVNLRNVPYEAGPFQHPEQARSRVAEAVRHFDADGDVQAVTLQRGRASGSVGATNLYDVSARHWTEEDFWDTVVVDRILSQQRGRTVLDSPATRRTPSAHKYRRPAPHVNTRWHCAAAGLLVVVVMVALLFLQTDGHPLQSFGVPDASSPRVKRELPFDAHSSFQSATIASLPRVASGPRAGR